MGVLDSLCTYETMQVIQVRSRTLSLVHHAMRICIIIYVALYIFWWEHGYQKEEKGLGTVSLKVKGAGHTGWGEGKGADERDLHTLRVQDAIDIVYPPKEEGAVFLTTNYVDVPRQSRGRCPSLNVADACDDGGDCAKGSMASSLTGYTTGSCVASGTSVGSTCELLGWCPTEPDNGTVPQDNLLAEVESFLLFARVGIDFPFAGQSTNNLHNGTYTAAPTDLTRGVNLFEVADVLRETNTTFADVAVNGAVFSISFNWDCNLDRDLRECEPEVSFRRLDDYSNPLSRGYNFRYATYYAEGGTEYRYLRKAYGLRLLVISAGRARSFDWPTVFVTLGSAVALLGVATVVVDGLAVYVLPKKDVYQRIKYHTMDEREEEERLMAERRAAGYGATDTAAPIGKRKDAAADSRTVHVTVAK